MPIKRQTIRDHSAEANLFARRSIVALLFVCSLLGVVISNLYYLQVTQHEAYSTRSNGNRIKVVPVAPNRGLIYDRNGVLLAENKPVFSLEIIPEQVDDIDGTLVGLASLLNISNEKIEEFRKNVRRQRRFKPVSLINQLDDEKVALFSANKHQFPGVSIEARLARHYPYGDVLTHVLGYVAKINKKDLQKLVEGGLEANYAATHDIGKRGIEKYHESILHGQVGYEQVEVNSRGRVIRTLSVDPPVPGRDIVLNIDIEAQLEAQRILGDRRGTIVLTSPQTGGVIAMYSNPSYDPNLFVHGISQKNYNALLHSKDKPLLNRATQGQYPPASTVKPHLALAGLELDVIEPDTTIFDDGKFSLPNVSHVWRDWKKWGHGKVNVTTSIENSCDTFFYSLAYQMGIDNIHDSMIKFGFGDYTGIDLYEESDANMPNRGWKRARFNQPWYIGDTIPVGIGQSYWTATPIQLNQSINVLANRGDFIIPQIMLGFMENGQVVEEPVKTRRPVDVIDSSNWDVILDAMYGTINRDHGSGYRAFKTAPYVAAGKTGTAQLFSVGQNEKYQKDKVAERLRDNAMFVGYAPYDSPEVTITVVLENAGFGGANAAPVARKMLDFYFKDREFPPREPEITKADL